MISTPRQRDMFDDGRLTSERITATPETLITPEMEREAEQRVAGALIDRIREIKTQLRSHLQSFPDSAFARKGEESRLEIGLEVVFSSADRFINFSSTPKKINVSRTIK